MYQIIGISAAGKLSVALVEGNHLSSPVSQYPPASDDSNQNEFLSMPMEEMVETVAEMVRTLCREHNAKPVAVGMCFPGIIRDGIVAESPNLKQAKGANICGMLTAALQTRAFQSQALTPRIAVCNDADATATGIAARRGQLESLIRVWTLGQGVGFGRYPHSEGPCEGGHIVVSLIRRKRFAAAEDAGTSKASWAIARCVCASSIWNRRRCLPTRAWATSAAWILSCSGIERWPLLPPPVFTWTGQANFLFPARTHDLFESVC